MGIDSNFLVDPLWQKKIFNPSRCAILASDQWATVSKSYRKEITEGSSLKELLHDHYKPFAFPNGVRSKVIKQKLSGLESRFSERQKIVKKFFGKEITEENDDYIIFGFVGRICEQKGIHLICESVKAVLEATNYKALFIIGGLIDGSDYSKNVANMMNNLKAVYRENFWANPTEFFYDGTGLTKAADYFLMPSKFEPGGIVQHEALIAGTPVIVFSTGGLKDSIKEFNSNTKEGNGFLFEHHDCFNFTAAVQRAYDVFKNKEDYNKLRENSERSYMDVSTVSRAWRAEFYRIKRKVV